MKDKMLTCEFMTQNMRRQCKEYDKYIRQYMKMKKYGFPGTIKISIISRFAKIVTPI